MKQEISPPVMIGIVVVFIILVVVIGIKLIKPSSEVPSGGYKGGQKAGAVNNPPNSAGQAPVYNNRGGAVNTLPTSSGK